MPFDTYNPAKPIRLRVFSPLGFYPQHSIKIPRAQLLVRDDLVVSAVQMEPAAAHGIGDEHFSDLEFLALEETRFLAAITLAVHPDDGMAYTYPLTEHVDVIFGLDDDQLLEVGREHTGRISERGDRFTLGKVLPPACGGARYEWRETGLDVSRVFDVVRATRLSNHLLMRGLGALLRADMCWRHREIAEAAVIQLYIALEASFQLVLRSLQSRGISNPSAVDAGALIDEVFNPGINTGSYFEDYYEGRIKTMHPSSRFGVFAVPPLEADDYFFLRHGMVEVYHWLITNRRLQPRVTLPTDWIARNGKAVDP